jgi:hypothetical protein
MINSAKTEHMERDSYYKSEEEIGTLCPVCGWDFEGNKADQICASCGFQFNYGDAFAKNSLERSLIYHGYRYRWINDGMPWSSNGQHPEGWNAKEQLRKIRNS